jgi:hypothetical protein
MNTAQLLNVEPNVLPLMLVALPPLKLTKLATILTKPANPGTKSKLNCNLTPQCQMSSSDVTKIADHHKLKAQLTTHNTCAKPTVVESLNYQPPQLSPYLTTNNANLNATNNVLPLTQPVSELLTNILLAIKATKLANLGMLYKLNYNLTPQCQLNTSDATKIADQLLEMLTMITTCAKLNVLELND